MEHPYSPLSLSLSLFACSLPWGPLPPFYRLFSILQGGKKNFFFISPSPFPPFPRPHFHSFQREREREEGSLSLSLWFSQPSPSFLPFSLHYFESGSGGGMGGRSSLCFLLLLLLLLPHVGGGGEGDGLFLCEQQGERGCFSGQTESFFSTLSLLSLSRSQPPALKGAATTQPPTQPTQKPKSGGRNAFFNRARKRNEEK